MNETSVPFDFSDVCYRVIDGHKLLARHYRPHGNKPAPTLVDVHGGGWVTGDRLSNAKIHEYLAARGIGVFALDYRALPVPRFPESVDDIGYGVRWLKDNAQDLKVYAPWIGGFGTSSGGHMLMLNALKPYAEVKDDALGRSDGALLYVVTCWPVLDPWARYQMAITRKRANIVASHRAFWPDDESMRVGNPQYIVDRREQEATPALLIVQGTADENVEHERADHFVSSYRKAGGTVTLEKFEGEKHSFLEGETFSAAGLRALAIIENFVLRHSLHASGDH